ncbi:heme o synthase [Fluviispira sanaruensis]|uniref:Protoheme IX farnesyltransferase n=1 Tax=Fluviispira sanaruensis TaxID=2493639 RepID=A0A4P2VMC6_FLUSA|nr:heme o synthase [Fluviispira sanaruensis]BBH54536.1 protoheme IX farnesyltransferase [Fluviispira sanaruensis]
MSKKNSTFKDYIELCKPRITFFCIIMTAGGVVLAPGNISLISFIMTLVGTALSVASANTFNMIYERNSDKLMKRTRARPIAMGRVKVKDALIYATILGMLSIFLLTYFVNSLTAILSFAAIASYSLIYTPLKSKTPLALVIGAFPGAMPPLLGWTAVNNQIDLAGLALFGVLFAWQMPHFIAIAIYHKDDYAKANIKVVPAVRGDQVAKTQAFFWSIALILISFLLVPLKVGGLVYFIIAIALGIWFLRLSIIGLKKDLMPNWPRKFFLASLVYLPVLVFALVIDRFVSIILNN